MDVKAAQELALPVMRVRGPSLENALPRLKAIEQSRVFSNFGSQEFELRQRFSQFLGVDSDRITTASNATIGLLGAVVTSGQQKWCSPSYTFPATPASILTAGRDLLFGDIGNDWWLDPREKNGRAIMPVAPFGAAIDFSRWQSHEHVVIDAAASLGAEAPKWQDMKEDWVVVYSLHATKILGSGEGSLLVFGSPERAAKFRVWTNFGFSGTRNSVTAGINGKMSEIQAAFAHSALDGWEEEKSDWQEARALALTVESQLSLQGLPWSADGSNPYWIVSFSSKQETQAVETALGKAGIESRRWWGLGCHTMPAYSHILRANLTVSDSIAAKNLGLPMFRGITESEIKRVADVISTTLEI